MMTRREANWWALCAAAAPWMLEAQQHAHVNAPADPHNWTGYEPKFFSKEEFAQLDEFTAILIPTDDTPGAREANVAPFIDFVVAAAREFAPEVQTRWRDAMIFLRDNQFATRQMELVTAMSRANAGKEHEVFQLIKEMTVRAYYTSRVGLIDVLQYQGNAYLTEFPACTHAEHHTV